MSTTGEVELPKGFGKGKWQMSKQWEKFVHKSFTLFQSQTFQLIVAVLGIGVIFWLLIIYLSTRPKPNLAQKSTADTRSFQA